MRYLCLSCIDEKKWDALSAKQGQALIEASNDYDAALAKRGGYYTAAALSRSGEIRATQSMRT